VKQSVTLPLSTLLLVAATVLGVVLLWQVRSLLVILAISVVLAASISPVVDRAERWHIPRWISTIAVYLGLLAVFVGAGLIVGPTAIEQIQRLLRQLPSYIEDAIGLVRTWLANSDDTRSQLIVELIDPQAITRWAIGSSQQLVLRSYSITRGIVGAAFSLVLSLFISGYMVADSRSLIRSIVCLFPQPWEDRLASQVTPITQRMGGYIRGRLLVSILLAVISGTTLGVLGLREYALGLGTIAGLTNLIPFIGPILGAIPAIVVAVSQGGWLVLWVILLFVVVQNLETYVLDPLLVGTSVGVHPLYQLLAVLGGAQVLGIIGALVVPPWVAGVGALLENLYLQPKLAAERETRS